MNIGEVVTVISIYLLAFAASFVFTGFSVPIAEVIGALDIPDGKRKINTHSLPRLGGIGFFIAFVIGALILMLAVRNSAAAENTNFLLAMLLGGGVITFAGILDDVMSLSAGVKFLLQTICAIIAIAFIGIPTSLSFFGIVTIPLSGAVGFFLSVFRIVFMINAVNFADGLDTLAGGLAIITLLSISIFALGDVGNLISTASMILVFAIMGFLPYNRYPAKIYMGDSGSQFLGFSIAVLTLSAGGGAFLPEISFFLFIPMLDASFSILRRIFHGKSPFIADRGHLHHMLLDHGISHPSAVTILLSAAAFIAAITLIIGKN